MPKKQVVSIDIGASAIKFVQLEWARSEIRLVQAGLEPYPSGEVSNEVISDALKRLLERMKGHRNNVSLSIPRLSVTTRRISNLPPNATQEQLKSIVAMQAQTALPFRVEDTVFDFHDVRQSGQRLSVELIAAKREDVQSQLDYLKPLGITPTRVTPSTLATSALARLQLAAKGQQGSDQVTMVADIGAGRTDLCLMAGDSLCFSRSFPVGGNHLTFLYQAEMDCDFERAENKKLTDATLNRNAPNAAPASEWANRLITEMKRTMGAAKRELNIERDILLHEIWLCGGGARLEGLKDYIADQLQIPTQHWNPLEGARERGSEGENGKTGKRENVPKSEIRNPKSEADGFGDTLAVALGAGVGALNNTLTLNLLPTAERVKLSHVQRQKRALIAGVAALILLVVTGITGLRWHSTQQAKIALVEKQLNGIGGSELAAKATLTRQLAMVNLLTPQRSPLDILYELSARFADRTRLAWTTFQVSQLDDPTKTKITFSVEALSHQDVNQMIRGLAQSGAFTNIKTGQVSSVERDKKPVFQVQVAAMSSEQ